MKGNWTRIGNPAEWETYICSECTKGMEYPTKFCPNCGAEMDDKIVDETYQLGADNKTIEDTIKDAVGTLLEQFVDGKYTLKGKLMMLTFYARNFGNVPEKIAEKIRKAFNEK